MVGPGLSLNSGLRVRASSAIATGSANMGTVDAAAFMPGATQAPQTGPAALSPRGAIGLTFWVGVGCLAALVVLRNSLPK